MNTWWTVLAAISLLIAVGTYVQVTLGNRRIGKLSDQNADGVEPWPFVSIVVAARNEQSNIAAALHSLLHLDYDHFEVIVVDDRSTDQTGTILDSLAVRSERLTVVHVATLPAGWLGKNHALWFGAQQARGTYLLFTDADVFMEPTTLKRSISYLRRGGVDHLTLSPDCEMPSLMLQAFVLLFFNLFALYTRPWKVSDPKSSAFIGIGAFNLVRREVYEAVGTHWTIAMRPDDDVKLGKIIKHGGYCQRILSGAGMIRVPWYSSVGELVSGMEKNAFSGVDYRITMVVLATAALLVVDVWPFFAIWILAGPARYLYLATVLTLLGHALQTAVQLRQSRWSSLLFPVAVMLMIYIQWRAMLLTFWNGGIRWRDTHYALADLKANKI